MRGHLLSSPERIMTQQLIQTRIEKCSQLLENCTLQDRAWAKRQLQKLNLKLPEQKVDSYLTNIEQRLQQSVLRVELRLQQPLTISYPEELPVSQKRRDIQQLIQQHQVVILCGETGSGKTTQLPKMCLELGRGARGLCIP